MHVRFQDLPEPLQRILLDLSGDKDVPGHTAVPTDGPVTRLVLAALGLIVIGASCVSLWRLSPTPTSLAARAAILPAAIGAFLILSGIARAFVIRVSRLKPLAVITPDLVILTRITSEPVSLFSIKKLDVRRIGSTSLDLVSAAGSRLGIAPTYRSDLPALVAAFQESRSILAHVADGSDRPHDWITVMARSGVSPAPSGSGRWIARTLIRLGGAAVIGIATICATWAIRLHSGEELWWTLAHTADDASSYEDYLEWVKRCEQSVREREVLELASVGSRRWQAESKLDDFAFEAAKKRATAGGWRAYLAEHPGGLHETDARIALRERYARADDEWVARAASIEKNLREGVRALLARLAESNDPTVRVAFVESAPFDASAAEKRARDALKSTNVAPIGSSLTHERNAWREQKVVVALRAAFLKVIPADAIELREGKEIDPGPRFVVHYGWTPTQKIFFPESQRHLPPKQRTTYIGFETRFEVELVVPGPKGEPDPRAVRFRFEHVVRPVPPQSILASAREPDRVYEAMADAAFAELAPALGKALALDDTPRRK